MDYGGPYRRSPDMNAGRNNYSRNDLPPPRNDYPRNEIAPRSRSQPRIENDYPPPNDYATYGRPLDKNLRSKSLDNRDAFRGDDAEYYENRRGGVTIPIRQEKRERNYDYDRERPRDTRDGRDLRESRDLRDGREGRDDFYVPIRREDRRDSRERIDFGRSYDRDFTAPMERIPRAVTRSTEYLDRRPVYDDRRPPRYPEPRHSPKSINSNKKSLNQSFEAGRNRRMEQQSSDFRGGNYVAEPNPRAVEWFNGRDLSRSGAAGGHKSYHSSYHHENYSGGAQQSGNISPPRRVISQQPHAITAGPGPMINTGPPGPPGPYVARPQAYHRVKCCCFNFTWPPWSYEPTTAPQPIYRNI